VDTQAGLEFAGADWGMPPGAVGEAYWNFNIMGVIIVFTLFGVILRILGSFFLANVHSPFVMTFYVITIQSLQPTQNSFRGWVGLLVPLLVVAIPMGLLSRKSHFNHLKLASGIRA
jgi:hypothetical protein